jgi:transcription initiation factor TFIIE subunit alpha
MKLTNKQIEAVISEVAGEDVLPLVAVLKKKKNISEFKLAELIEHEVNKTRNMLYRLYHANLVNFIRKKDKKRGWYIYYWTFNPKRVQYLLISLRKGKLDKLKERLEREQENHFFICPNRCIRLDFEQAIGFEFKCPECGSLMEEEDNKLMIKEIEAEIKQIEGELKV